MTREEFIAAIAPAAVKLRLEGSPLFPSVRIAQAILETGGVIPAWNNLVGYKVGSGVLTPYWKGRSVNKSTWEVYDGGETRVRADFRAYDSVEDSFRDQDLLFDLERYRRVREAKTPGEQIKALLAGGYATDPDYAKKLDQLTEQYALTRYDKEVDDMLEQLMEQIRLLQEEVRALREQKAMTEIPVWAQEAVQAAAAAGILDTTTGGSYDFYRFVTILHRLGLFDAKGQAG
ncbi:glucosaminidase domain-containing protein [Paenibacillus aurantius]|uniref:Glucosaminidase domain-containing protein n=1 Tax=Paenibacillus aurantius TaxID=2918900 RepID=A0AA96LF67_9BACL|nr:glucosaminidase domain-containing protein [Paenibacillus aurantius]WNQ12636.1 glucosaminidase domain-containing protein [Paenibacillus aurantius]